MKAKPESGEAGPEARKDDSAAPGAPAERRMSGEDSSSPSSPSAAAKADAEKGGDGGGEGSGGGESGAGAGAGGPSAKAARPAEAETEKMGRKGMMKIALEGLCNGMLIMLVTQGLSRLYFEEQQATMVGLTISLICCIVMLLGMKSIARFIVFHRMIMRTMKGSPLRTEFFCRWLDEIVVHGITLFITMLLLTASRLVV